MDGIKSKNNNYSVVFSIGPNGEYGDLNSKSKLPWPRNRHEVKNLRRITTARLLSGENKQNLVVMGKNTWPMFGDKLVGRVKVLVTSNKNKTANDYVLTKSQNTNLLRRASSSAFSKDLLSKLTDIRNRRKQNKEPSKAESLENTKPADNTSKAHVQRRASEPTIDIPLVESDNFKPDMIVHNFSELFNEYDKLNGDTTHMFIIGGKTLIESIIEYRDPTWIYITQLEYVGHENFDLVDKDKQVRDEDRYIYLNVDEVIKKKYQAHSVIDFQYSQDGSMHDIQFSLYKLKSAGNVDPPYFINTRC